MSASLVGSEMCIRDRQEAPREARRLSISCRPSSGVSRVSGPNPSSPVPVSYTHLTLPTICSV
eukprot:791943-Alexandrium_andersonii.AAC.1